MIKPEEAKGLFDKWLTENTLLFCSSRLHSCWGFLLRGHVAVLSEDLVEVRSEDGAASLKLRFSDVEDFEYKEPKDAPAEIREALPKEFGNAGTLVVALPLRPPLLAMPRDLLYFMEIPESFDK